MAVELDGRFARQHLLDPDHAAAFLLRVCNGLLHLFGDSRRVRCARAQHHLRRGIDRRNRANQMHDALLARDAADEQHIRPGGVDAIPLERVSFLDVLVERRVDAVVDDVDSLRAHIGHAQDVLTRTF